MIVNNDKIKQNIGTIIDEATIIELVDKAKNFKQSIMIFIIFNLFTNIVNNSLFWRY